MNIYEKLATVQQELKAPKDKKNTFAGYNYRSAEGILEAVKPLLKKYGLSLIISDEIEQIGDRIYVKATAWVMDPEEKQDVKVTAYAREANEKKGLDVSQVTGTASSYARKYALNGLLLIDDTKDADTDEYAKQTEEKKDKQPEKAAEKGTLIEYASEAAIKTIKIMVDKAGLTLDKVLKKPIEELTADEAAKMIIALKKKLRE